MLEAIYMDWSALGKGLALGFAMAAPVGPIGLLTIRRSINFSTAHGFVTGLGAATADTVYGLIAAFGLTLISDFLLAQKSTIQFVGGILLIIIGCKIFWTKPQLRRDNSRSRSLWSIFISALFLTFANPATILSFFAVFAGLGLASDTETYMSALSLVAGIFVGSAGWWFLLSAFSGIFRQRIDVQGMQWINRSSGVLIAGFGIAALYSLL